MELFKSTESEVRVYSRAFPVIFNRAKNAHLYTEDGKEYLDFLAGAGSLNYGHNNDILKKALLEYIESDGVSQGLDMFTTAKHDFIESYKKHILDPRGLDYKMQFTGPTGTNCVEAALKLARKVKGRNGIVSFTNGFHGVTMGALSITGLAAVKGMFEPLVPGAIKVPNTNTYRLPDHAADESYFAEEIEQAILREGPETICAVFLEPVQNAGGCFVPPDGYFQRVREICDRYGILLVSDEVICAYGRLGTMFGCERLGYQPDIITSAKGLTSGYAPLGAMLVSDRLAEPFADTDEQFLHGYTFAGHPVSCAVALANLDLFEHQDFLGNVMANETYFRAALDDLSDLPIVGDVRGMGYFYGIELVKDPETKETFTSDEAQHLLRGFLSNRLAELGLLCRADARGEPVIQLSPPLIAGPTEFDTMNQVIRQALTEAMAVMEGFSS